MFHRDIQTPRISAKILRCASYFQLSSRCLDIPIKHGLSCLIYYINNDQTGFLKGRFIGENIRLINSVIDYAEKQNIPGLLLFVDFEKGIRYSGMDLRLASTRDFLLQECKNLKGIFLKLKYPEKLIDSAINRLHYPTDRFKHQLTALFGLRCHLT